MTEYETSVYREMQRLTAEGHTPHLVDTGELKLLDGLASVLHGSTEQMCLYHLMEFTLHRNRTGFMLVDADLVASLLLDFLASRCSNPLMSIQLKGTAETLARQGVGRMVLPGVKTSPVNPPMPPKQPFHQG